MELLGGLANGWSLISLCVYITLEAIPRILQPHRHHLMAQGRWFIGVAAVGFFVNLFATLLFAQSGHGHSHGPGPKSKTCGGHDHGHSHSHGGGMVEGRGGEEGRNKVDLNMRAVFIHFFGDCLSSLCVLLTGVAMEHSTSWWIIYIDPISSLIIVLIILITTVPLVRYCSSIVLMGVPEHVDTGSVRDQLNFIEDVYTIHDLHLFEVKPGECMATVRVRLHEGADSKRVISDMKRVLHGHDIHTSSVEVDYTSILAKGMTPVNRSHCVPECQEEWCCG